MTDDKFIYTAGHVNRANIASLDGDGALVCFSRINGAYQWHVTWSGTLYDDALGLTMSADSMLYMVGYHGTYDKGSQIYLNKYSRTGQLIWNRIWGGSKAEDARALVADPPILVMDEPTLGLDVLSNRVILEYIKRERAEGKTIILSTHYLDEAESMCDQIGLLHEGRLVAEGDLQTLRAAAGQERLSNIFLTLVHAGQAALSEIP